MLKLQNIQHTLKGIHKWKKINVLVTMLLVLEHEESHVAVLMEILMVEIHVNYCEDQKSQKLHINTALHQSLTCCIVHF